jgi:hypothetical protein
MFNKVVGAGERGNFRWEGARAGLRWGRVDHMDAERRLVHAKKTGTDIGREKVRERESE